MKKLWLTVCAAAGISLAAHGAAAGHLGALTPDEAIAFIRDNPDVLIVDVAATRWYKQEHFPGAVNIPIEELSDAQEAQRYKELPADRPVLMHCRLGMIVPGAYQRLTKLRPDIETVAYIDGAPPFAAFEARESK